MFIKFAEDRIKALASKWAIPGWILVIGSAIWDIWILTGHASTASWLIDIVHPVVNKVRALHPSGFIPIGLFLIGLLWLGFIAFAPPDPLASELKKIATEDAEKIKERIRQIGQRVEFHLSPGSDPYIDVVMDLLNTSVFHVVTYGEVHGQTMYAGKHLAAVPQIFDRLGPPGVTCVSMKHADSGELRIRQFLSAEVADAMWANRFRNVAVDMSLVGVTFKVLLTDRLDKFTFYGPRITIDEATRV